MSDAFAAPGGPVLGLDELHLRHRDYVLQSMAGRKRPVLIRLLLALLLLAVAAPALALAATPEQWEAVSNTAMAITGNVRLSPDRITFQNGQPLPLVSAGTLPQFGGPTGPVSATLYSVTKPDDPVVLHGNRLCGDKGRHPATFIAVWKPALVGSDIDPRAMAIFSGNARPTVADGPDFCGTYFYEAGRL